MPKILEPHLEIEYNPASHASKVIITCDLSFDSNELRYSDNQYSVQITLKGDDPVYDDNLFTEGESFTRTGEMLQHYRYEQWLGNSVLNEDRPGRDEVYALIKFHYGGHSGFDDTRKTNTIRRKF